MSKTKVEKFKIKNTNTIKSKHFKDQKNLDSLIDKLDTYRSNKKEYDELKSKLFGIFHNTIVSLTELKKNIEDKKTEYEDFLTHSDDGHKNIYNSVENIDNGWKSFNNNTSNKYYSLENTGITDTTEIDISNPDDLDKIKTYISRCTDLQFMYLNSHQNLINIHENIHIVLSYKLEIYAIISDIVNNIDDEKCDTQVKIPKQLDKLPQTLKNDIETATKIAEGIKNNPTGLDTSQGVIMTGGFQVGGSKIYLTKKIPTEDLKKKFDESKIENYKGRLEKYEEIIETVKDNFVLENNKDKKKPTNNQTPWTDLLNTLDKNKTDRHSERRFNVDVTKLSRTSIDKDKLQKIIYRCYDLYRLYIKKYIEYLNSYKFYVTQFTEFIIILEKYIELLELFDDVGCLTPSDIKNFNIIKQMGKLIKGRDLIQNTDPGLTDIIPQSGGNIEPLKLSNFIPITEIEKINYLKKGVIRLELPDGIELDDIEGVEKPDTDNNIYTFTLLDNTNEIDFYNTLKKKINEKINEKINDENNKISEEDKKNILEDLDDRIRLAKHVESSKKVSETYTQTLKDFKDKNDEAIDKVNITNSKTYMLFQKILNTKNGLENLEEGSSNKNVLFNKNILNLFNKKEGQERQEGQEDMYKKFEELKELIDELKNRKFTFDDFKEKIPNITTQTQSKGKNQTGKVEEKNETEVEGGGGERAKGGEEAGEEATQEISETVQQKQKAPKTKHKGYAMIYQKQGQDIKAYKAKYNDKNKDNNSIFLEVDFAEDEKIDTLDKFVSKLTEEAENELKQITGFNNGTKNITELFDKKYGVIDKSTIVKDYGKYITMEQQKKLVEYVKKTEELSEKINKIIKYEINQGNKESIERLIVKINEDVFGSARVIIKYRDDNDVESANDMVVKSGNCVLMKNCAGNKCKDEGKAKLYGPFKHVFDEKDDTEIIFNDAFDKDGLIAHVLQGKTLITFGFGFSGSGKTYQLTSSTNENNLLKQSIKKIIEGKYTIINDDNLSQTQTQTVKVTKIELEIQELYPYKKEGEKAQHIKYDKEDLTDNYGYGGDFDNPGENSSEKSNEFINNILEVFDNITKDRINNMRITPTPNNPESSRSHIFFIINVTFEKDGRKDTGKFVIVDMAGAENTIEIRRQFLFNPEIEDYFSGTDEEKKKKLEFEKQDKKSITTYANIEKNNYINIINNYKFFIDINNMDKYITIPFRRYTGFNPNMFDAKITNFFDDTTIIKKINENNKNIIDQPSKEYANKRIYMSFFVNMFLEIELLANKKRFVDLENAKDALTIKKISMDMIIKIYNNFVSKLANSVDIGIGGGIKYLGKSYKDNKDKINETVIKFYENYFKFDKFNLKEDQDGDIKNKIQEVLENGYALDEMLNNLEKQKTQLDKYNTFLKTNYNIENIENIKNIPHTYYYKKTITKTEQKSNEKYEKEHDKFKYISFLSKNDNINYKNPVQIIICAYILYFIDKINEEVSVPNGEYKKIKNFIIALIMSVIVRYINIVVEQGKGIITTLEHLKYFFLYNTTEHRQLISFMENDDKNRFDFSIDLTTESKIFEREDKRVGMKEIVEVGFMNDYKMLPILISLSTGKEFTNLKNNIDTQEIKINETTISKKILKLEDEQSEKSGKSGKYIMLAAIKRGTTNDSDNPKYCAAARDTLEFAESITSIPPPCGEKLKVEDLNKNPPCGETQSSSIGGYRKKSLKRRVKRSLKGYRKRYNTKKVNKRSKKLLKNKKKISKHLVKF